MFTVFLILALLALALAAFSVASPRTPLWAAVVVLCLIELLRSLPLR